jgi:N-acetylmuramoyl-L-alanine amidase
MIYISAGHNPKGIKTDSGAVGNGYTEANLAVEFRNLVISNLKAKNAPYVSDNDDERLAQYLERIKTGNASVVLEFHFDASDKPSATGCTSLVSMDADRLDNAFAKELVEATSFRLGIKNRGLINEAQSHRGRLGLMRENGIVCLLELCFISNKSDIEAYQENKVALAKDIADIIIKYENLV